MDELNIKQHFRADEGPIIDQISDWIVQANDQYRPVLTPFLILGSNILHKHLLIVMTTLN